MDDYVPIPMVFIDNLICFSENQTKIMLVLLAENYTETPPTIQRMAKILPDYYLANFLEMPISEVQHQANRLHVQRWLKIFRDINGKEYYRIRYKSDDVDQMIQTDQALYQNMPDYDDVLERLLETSEWCCSYCTEELSGDHIFVDRMNPDGQYEFGNIAPVCGLCYFSKNDDYEKYLSEWYKHRKFLYDNDILERIRALS